MWFRHRNHQPRFQRWGKHPEQRQYPRFRRHRSPHTSWYAGTNQRRQLSNKITTPKNKMLLHALTCHTLTGNGYFSLLPNDSSMDTCASSPTSPAPGGHLPPPKGGTITSALTFEQFFRTPQYMPLPT